jgi:hypothetical protein
MTSAVRVSASQKWRYEFATSHDGLNMQHPMGYGQSPIEAFVQSMGILGWELCGSYNCAQGIRFIFKRPMGWEM